MPESCTEPAAHLVALMLALARLSTATRPAARLRAPPSCQIGPTPTPTPAAQRATCHGVLATASRQQGMHRAMIRT
eukprot:7004043-Alexandrium_andersonii.AAC.1